MRDGFAEGVGVSLTEKAVCADLGGSSNYSNENFEGRVKVRVSCETHCDMSYSLLRHSESACNTRALLSSLPKGNQVNIPEIGRG